MVTNYYVVGYACKGDKPLSIEKISKEFYINQESMCELAKLPMVICSESIETISLSAAKRFTDGKETTSSFVTKYKNRDAQLDLSLHQYFNLLKK